MNWSMRIVIWLAVLVLCAGVLIQCEGEEGPEVPISPVSPPGTIGGVE